MSDQANFSRPHDHLAALDGYRGLAAIAVALQHVLYQLPHTVFKNNFVLSVDFFFILSGLVISRSYETKIVSGALGFYEFLKLRLIRLWPMILIGAVLGISWRLFESRFSISSVVVAGLAALLMMPLPRFGQVGSDSFPINGPGWSVTHELLVNIAFAVLAKLLKGAVLWICFSVFVFTEITLAIKDGRCDWAVSWVDQPSAFIRALAPFLLGVIIHRLWSKRMHHESNFFPIIGAFSLVLVLIMPFSGLLYSFFCIYLIFPLVIVAGSFRLQSSRLRAALLVLGEISYPLYAINEPMARFMGYCVERFWHGLSGGTLVLTVFGEIGLIALVALAVSRIYDLPTRRWLRQKLLAAEAR